MLKEIKTAMVTMSGQLENINKETGSALVGWLNWFQV